MGATTFEERVYRFGADDVLVGIVTAPVAPEPTRPAVVILNAGLVHRVGPFRLHVELARRLAAEGTLVLRLDQSSIGDSGDRPSGLPYDERVLLDGKEALDFLAATHGSRRFVLVGLCSGAMNAHRIALADGRVAGACLLDGYVYPTRSAFVRRLVPRLVNPDNWIRAWGRARELAARTRRPSATPSVARDDAREDAPEIFAEDWPPKDDIRRELDRLVARGTRLSFIYTGGWSGYVHEGQFDAMFPGLRAGGGLEVHFFPDADHTFVLVEQRRRLFDAVSRFVARAPLQRG